MSCKTDHRINAMWLIVSQIGTEHFSLQKVMIQHVYFWSDKFTKDGKFAKSQSMLQFS